MTFSVLPQADPVSSGEIPAVDFQRVDDVAHKHSLLAEYLELKKYDALLLQDPANFSWLTCGGDNTRRSGADPVAALLITPEARVVLCNNVDSGQIFDKELAGLGFLLKERPWTENSYNLRSDVCRGRKVGGDVWFPGTDNVAGELQEFRLQLTERDTQQARELGHQVAHAVEATARNFEAGSTEADVAGHLAHRLIKHQIEPVRIQVMADGQGWRYRHWAYGSEKIERQCVVSAIGRRHGLHVSATRTVCLGAPPAELEETHRLATLIQTTGLHFTQSGWSMEETWKRVDRIYEKFGVPDEWRQSDQADLTGYKLSERVLNPQTKKSFETGNIVHWHPSVRASSVGDTMLIGEKSCEVLTPMQNWPVLAVQVKNHTYERPGILIRELSR